MSFTAAPSSPHRRRAEENFKAAVLRLQGTIPKDTSARIGQVTFPNFDNIDGVEDKASKLEDALEKFIQARTELGKKESRRKRVEDVIVTLFRASYPFANLFLTVANQSSAVRDFSSLLIVFLDTCSEPLWATLWWSACSN
jgi:hypothetical protein